MKADAIIGAVQGVTKKWAKQRKREEREANARLNRYDAMTHCYHVSIREAAWDVMEEAYDKASAGGTLPAHARQIMYAARPHIMEAADRRIGKSFDQYFTQTLLPDFIEENDCAWNVVFDARGNFREPHTDENVPLGTLQVSDYLHRVNGHMAGEPDFTISEKHYPTMGPENRFGAVLFIEKEGFMPLFKAVNLAERYDIAIMSTKGMSVVASRELVDRLCGSHDIPLLVLHDFDKAGFSIYGTLCASNRRYQFRNDIQAVNLGLRLDDIDGLESEPVYMKSPHAARRNLKENGATDAEIQFLISRRVELNAFASDALIEWIERKFKEHGICKVVPDEKLLATAYRRALRQAIAQRKVDEAVEAAKAYDEMPPPDGLLASVQNALKDNPAASWDQAIKDIARDDSATLAEAEGAP